MTPCVAVCVWERERAPATEQKHLCEWLEPHFSPSRLSLSLSHIHSLFQSPYHSETLKLLRKILRYGRVCPVPVPVSLLFEHPLRVHTHTHTHLTFYVSAWANFLSQSRHFLHVSSHHMRSSSTLRIPLRSGAALSPLSPTLGTS